MTRISQWSRASIPCRRTPGALATISARCGNDSSTSPSSSANGSSTGSTDWSPERRSSAIRSIFDPADFPWARALEGGMAHDPPRARSGARPPRRCCPTSRTSRPTRPSITDDDGWKTYFFYGFGFRVGRELRPLPRNRPPRRAPSPACRPRCSRSWRPRKHIPDHCGPYKGLVRYHLALQRTDAGRSGARSGSATSVATWHEGESLIFDDTYEHEVWNDTDGGSRRAVPRRGPPAAVPDELLNRAVLKLIAVSPFVTDAKRRHRAWERDSSAATTARRDRLGDAMDVAAAEQDLSSLDSDDLSVRERARRSASSAASSVAGSSRGTTTRSFAG